MFWQEEPAHYRTIVISGVLSAVAAAAVGWMAASFEMGRTVSLDTARITQLQADVQVLAVATKRAPSREEFAAFQTLELQHWAEQHDFFVRQDQRTDEIIRDHARIMGLVEAHDKALKDGDPAAGGMQ